MTEIITGDDTDLTLTLQNADGTAFVLTGATSVLVSLIRTDRASVLAGPYTATAGTAGAVWATGTVVVAIPGADTAALTVTTCDIEVQAILSTGKKRTWPRVSAGPVTITKGLIP